MKKAWRTTWSGMMSIVAAETRGQAKMKTFRGAFDPKWNEIKAVRAPEHDGWASVDASGHCWNERLLPVAPRPSASAEEGERHA